MPKALTLSRGTAQGYVNGLVWTLDRQQAERDARVCRSGVIAEAIILKREAFAFYADRAEVLADPERVDMLGIATLTAA